MLNKLRGGSEKWITKILIFAIGASFIFLGISGNSFSNANIAFEVANQKVSVMELESELKRQISQMQNAMGGDIKFNYKQAMQMGLLDQVINNMIYRILLDAEIQDQGIYVSDDKIYQIIKGTKEFQDDNGEFSPEKFAYILNVNAVAEKTFVEEIANEVARELLANSVVSNIDVSVIAEILYKQKNEQRVMDIVSFNLDKEKIATLPKDEELEELYKLNIDKFQQPEFRKISYIVISAEDAKDYKNIKKDDVDKLYKTMIEIGENIIDEVNGGSKIDEIVESFEVQKVTLPDLNAQGKKRDGTAFSDTVFTQKYRDIAFFALDENGVSDVLDAGDNIILVLVEEVFPPQPKSFESVKFQLKIMWKDNMQISQASKKANDILANLNNGDKFSSAVIAVDRTANAVLNSKTGRFNNAYSADLLNKVFVSDMNAPFMLKDGNTYYVGVVRSVVLPEITQKDKAEFEKFKEIEEANFAENVFDDYLSYLYKKHGVERNVEVINKFFTN